MSDVGDTCVKAEVNPATQHRIIQIKMNKYSKMQHKLRRAAWFFNYPRRYANMFGLS